MNLLLKKISNMLLANIGCIEEFGLIKGKMGVCIFFYVYSRYTKSQIYEEIAKNLFNEIKLKLFDAKDIGVLNGVCSIGIGANYLRKTEYEPSSVLSTFINDIDNYILNNSLSVYASDLKDKSSLWSVGLYIITRMEQWLKNDNKFFEKVLLNNVNIVIRDFGDNGCISKRLPFIWSMNLVLDYYQRITANKSTANQIVIAIQTFKDVIIKGGLAYGMSEVKLEEYLIWKFATGEKNLSFNPLNSNIMAEQIIQSYPYSKEGSLGLLANIGTLIITENTIIN